MSSGNVIGQRIRKVRRTQGRSIYEIAAASGITPSLVSKIETGRSNPPVATLTRIAKALGVTISSLLDESTASRTIYTAGDGIKPAQMTLTDKGYRFLALAAGRHDKAMQVFVFEGEKGKVRKQALSHTGEELVFMLEGEMLYSVGSVQYRMKAGDSLYFDAEEDHDVEPVSKRVRYLAIFVERSAKNKSKR